jgi:hypothetical protein
MVTKLVVEILNNQVCLGILGFSLIMLPIIGIAKIHELPNGKIEPRKTDYAERMPGDD